MDDPIAKGAAARAAVTPAKAGVQYCQHLETTRLRIKPAMTTFCEVIMDWRAAKGPWMDFVAM
ncbi:MAG: hypothetical protein Q9M13_09280, partial [Mariprofundales bacterium]|nr:hypothetical protein [Mariprofundales bacterium]